MKKKLLAGLAMGIVLGGPAASGNAAVLTFDDITTGPGGTFIADGYGGFNWGSMNFIDPIAWGFSTSGYENGTVSGDYVAYSSPASGYFATVSNTLFDFSGAYLTGAWNDGLNIEVTGYLAGSQTGQRTVVVNSDGPTWFDFNFSGIDSLSFRSYGGTNAGAFADNRGEHFAMDNFTYYEAFSEPESYTDPEPYTDPVPEPATMLLFGSGLAGLAGARRRRKKG
ncbi:MAG: PEP-CTERM sorting domain-containing protein [Thermodesulfobacteriota bacterium]